MDKWSGECGMTEWLVFFRCQTIFEKTPVEEKKLLEARIQETGSYKGFKLRQYYEYVGFLPSTFLLRPFRLGWTLG